MFRFIFGIISWLIMIPKIHMYIPRAIILALAVPLFFCSCDSRTSEGVNYAYFGGEIVNPNTNYLILSKDRNHHDTIFLDKNNQFRYKIEISKKVFILFNTTRKIKSFF